MKAQTVTRTKCNVGDICHENCNEAFLLSCILINETSVSDDEALSDSLYKENIRSRHRIFEATAPEVNAIANI